MIWHESLHCDCPNLTIEGSSAKRTYSKWLLIKFSTLPRLSLLSLHNFWENLAFHTKSHCFCSRQKWHKWLLLKFLTLPITLGELSISYKVTYVVFAPNPSIDQRHASVLKISRETSNFLAANIILRIFIIRNYISRLQLRGLWRKTQYRVTTETKGVLCYLIFVRPEHCSFNQTGKKHFLRVLGSSSDHWIMTLSTYDAYKMDL